MAHAASHGRMISLACGALVCAIALVASPAALGQRSVDECAALNGVRYESPDNASGAQYVGVNGACNAADDPNADVEVIPVGGPRTSPGSGGDDGGSGSAGTPSRSPEAGGTDVGPERGGSGPEASPASRRPPSDRPGDTTDGTPDVTPEIQVARALSAADDERPRFMSVGSLFSAQVGLPLLAGLALVGLALGLRKRLN